MKDEIVNIRQYNMPGIFSFRFQILSRQYKWILRRSSSWKDGIIYFWVRPVSKTLEISRMIIPNNRDIPTSLLDIIRAQSPR